MEDNKKVEKSTTLKQDLYIAMKQFNYKWKIIVLGIAIFILIAINILLVKFNINFDNITHIEQFDFFTLRNLPILGDVNMLYYTIHILLIIISILLIGAVYYGFYKFLKVLSKPFNTNKIIQICEDLKIYFGKETKRNFPIPIVEKKLKGNKRIKEMELYANGTITEDWEKENRLQRFSQKFGKAVVGVEQYEEDFEKIHLYYRKDYSKEMLFWKDEYLVKDDCTLVLGQNNLGKQETINLNDNPHLIIAGMSGSGKSVEMMSLLMQNILKGNRVIIGEFVKGGVDYNKNWKNLKNCEIYTDIDLFCGLFGYELSHELDVRKELLKTNNCKNISEYNKKIENGEIKGETLQRIIIALDEAGQVFIKSKDKKEG